MLNKNFNPFPILVTKRLFLRQLVISDAHQIFALRSDGEINRYLGRQASKTIDDALNFINTVNQNIISNTALYWAITLKGRNTLIGTICLYNFSDDGHCEIGYELMTSFQGHGLMYEAAKKVIDYAFNTIQIRQIEAFLHKGNELSIKLLKKLSFQYSNKCIEHEPDLTAYFLTNVIDNI